MIWPNSTEQPSAIELAQAVLQSNTSIHLEPQDIALLILIRSELDSRAEGAIAINLDTIRGLLSRIDLIENRDPKSAERRLSESLGRLKMSGCLSIFDVFRVHDSPFTDYQVTGLGDALYAHQIQQQAFSGRPLITILRIFISVLEQLVRTASGRLSQEDWDYDVVLPLQHAVKALLESAERVQKQMDRQHASIREFLPTLLKEGGEEAIDACVERLREVFEAIGDLQSAALVSIATAQTLLDRLRELALGAVAKRADDACDEISWRLLAVEGWIIRRAADWNSHHNVMHSHLRSNLYIDSNRRVTEAVRKAIVHPPGWTVSVVRAPHFMRMRADLVSSYLKQSPRLARDLILRERETRVVPVDPIPQLLREILDHELTQPSILLSNIFKSAFEQYQLQLELIPYFSWVIQELRVAGRIDPATRHWVRTSPRLALEEVRICK